MPRGHRRLGKGDGPPGGSPQQERSTHSRRSLRNIHGALRQAPHKDVEGNKWLLRTLSVEVASAAGQGHHPLRGPAAGKPPRTRRRPHDGKPGHGVCPQNYPRDTLETNQGHDGDPNRLPWANNRHQTLTSLAAFTNVCSTSSLLVGRAQSL